MQIQADTELYQFFAIFCLFLIQESKKYTTLELDRCTYKRKTL